MKKQKAMGQIFTPNYIAKMILDGAGYFGDKVLYTTLLEPSFGDGALLSHIIERLIDEGIKKGLAKERIAQLINSNVHGIELDKYYYGKTIDRLNKIMANHNIPEIPWNNLTNDNFLTFPFTQPFDFIIGNPPYIRIQNLDELTRLEIDKFRFSGGNTDSYILFFEKGINLLSDEGKLGFITPNSYFRNHSQRQFRAFLSQNNLIDSIIDFKDSPVFSEADTYTAITLLSKKRDMTTFKYAEYKSDVMNFNVEMESSTLDEAPWIFSSEDDCDFLNVIKGRDTSLEDLCKIQFGIATNGDAVYVGIPEKIKGENDRVIFHGVEIEAGLLKKAYKTVDWDQKMMLFPYAWDNERGRFGVIDEESMMKDYPLTYKYLLLHKDKLLTRDMDRNCLWYEFGRRQGLASCGARKLVISRFIDGNEPSLRVTELDGDSLVYSGIFITSDNEADLYKAKQAMESEDFIKFCRLKGKDMKGKWKMINAKIIKEFRIENYDEKRLENEEAV